MSIKNHCFFFIITVLMTACNAQDIDDGTTSQSQTFTNPILSGFYPDPSIVKVEGDYYMTNSSFGYFPGLPLFHSTDLVNWTQIGHVLDRPEQLELEGRGVSRGLFAPAISYDDGTYYVICTNVDGNGNFVVTAQDPRGPWSDPVWLPQVSGIDPSIFFNDDGSAYIVYNSEPPNNISEYSGHRSIKIVAFDKENLKVISDPKIIVNGGVDITQKPVWIEAPHIYQKGRWYYLMCAEGGTGFEHSEVIFRSSNVEGPYEPWDQNPILTQRDLDRGRSFPVECAGHADMVIGPDGNWWAVFLATRPYETTHFNIGRETFLLPVDWPTGGWPTILPQGETIKYTHPTPAGTTKKIDDTSWPQSGNFTFRDDFEDLKMNWTFLRTPKEKWHEVKEGKLTLQVRPETASGTSNPSFLAARQQYHHGSTTVKMEFEPGQKGEQAGLLIFQNETHYYLLCKELDGTNNVLSLYRSNGSTEEKIKSVPVNEGPLYLKYVARGEQLDFYYSYDEKSFDSVEENVDAKILSTQTAGGFVGIMQALYATSNGQSSDNSVSFDWFEINVDEPVYK